MKSADSTDSLTTPRSEWSVEAFFTLTILMDYLNG